MDTREKRRVIPQWIWHPERERRMTIDLVKRFTLDRPIIGAELRLALTGAVTIELDGTVVSHVDESAANICAFRRIEAFPDRLEAGEHTLRLSIECQSVMPVAPISIHLHERKVGCIAYLSAESFWLPTDDSWLADQVPAAIVCRLGEEPFGDLEDGPEWFVAGGFGDIETSPLQNTAVLSAVDLSVLAEAGVLRIQGEGQGTVAIPEPNRRDLHIFYHVRKQTEWRECWEALRLTELAKKPSCTLDLGKEYNARFWLRNGSPEPLTIVWNGAESLHELEHYEGLMTEIVRLAPNGGEAVTLPQGLRYFRLFVLAEAGCKVELEWRAEEAVVPMREAGSLRTDSSMLRSIYDISSHTSRICHQVGLWDGIKRDRLNWTYDFYLAAKTDYVLWDDLSVLKRSIEELGRGTPEGYWMNAIPSYTLWWLNNLWEYYLHTGDKDFIVSLRDEIERHCRQVESYIDPVTRSLSNYSPTLIEWVPMNEDEAWLGMQALFRITGDRLRRMKHFLPELDVLPDWGWPELEAERFLQGEQLITKMLGMLAGYIGKEDAVVFLSHYEAQDPITPLSAYWLADCCSQFGLQEKAWEAISKVWGKMVDEGATTCWESVTLQHDKDFHDALTTYTAYDSYRISLCHSWASTPIYWLVSRVLGVEPVEPGYRSISFQPSRIAGISVCMGTIPTPYGPIEAGWDDALSDEFTLRLPQGIRLASL